MKNRILSLILIATFGIVGCSNGDGDYTPKPSAFYRITMPEKDYKLYDTNILPFTFEYPEYSQIKIKRNDNDVKFLDLTFPQFNGTVFLTYKTLGGKRTVAGEADTAHQMVAIHYNMASGGHEQSYNDYDNHIYANTYTLKGKSIASTYQFWATDSTKHFLRGAFYINSNPNYDSLQPVYDFIHQDIVHLIETLKWK